jgi:hypothetical protein
VRHRPALAFALLASTSTAVIGCATDDSPDDENDPALAGGKADGTSYTECELGAVVAYLNSGVTIAGLETAGVHSRAADNLVEHRDGEDGDTGTADDDMFDDIAEVDAVPYVGPIAMRALVEAIRDRCPAGDIYADARDVDKALVVFPPGAVAPTDYTYPEDTGELSLGGTEFWQKWTGGHNPTYSFEEGTDAGRLCMQASAIRFETIMRTPPAEMVQLAADTNWDGSFFNWNDDYSQAEFGDASGARLWAWKTYLIKWISQTRKDGSCFVPTRDLVVRAATECLATATRNGDGEIQGCSAR